MGPEGYLARIDVDPDEVRRRDRGRVRLDPGSFTGLVAGERSEERPVEGDAWHDVLGRAFAPRYRNR